MYIKKEENIMGMWRYRYTCSKTGVKVYQFEHSNQYMIVHPDGTIKRRTDKVDKKTQIIIDAAANEWKYYI